MTTSNQANDASYQDRAKEQLGAAKDAATRALSSTRDQAQHAFEASRDSARKVAQGLESNPIGIVVGGVAVGVLAAALLPKTDRERELLAPVGKRLGAAAAAAIAAARENGQQELASRGLTVDGLKDQARSLVEGVSKAATTAGQAAAQAAREKAQAGNDTANA